MTLTDDERQLVARARELSEVPADGNCAYTGEADPVNAAIAALGRAKALLGELADLADRLGRQP